MNGNEVTYSLAPGANASTAHNATAPRTLPADHIQAAHEGLTVRIEEAMIDGKISPTEYQLLQYLVQLWANLSRQLLTRTSLWQ